MADLSQSTVLIVDDTKANINVLIQALKGEYKLGFALDGQSALAYVQKNRPDLILLDIMMPEMDGYEVCRRLKANPATRDIPVLFISALDEVVNKTAGFESGAVDYITKPFEILEVKARVKTHLELTRARQDLVNANKRLRESERKIQAANQKLLDSIQYAKLIQRSLLPDINQLRCFLPESFLIWMPKDIVGGDIVFAHHFHGGLIIVIADCTGHGVPGAFMTMIATSGMRSIIIDEQVREPALILKQLNAAVKSALRQDDPEAPSDDGLDAAVCCIRDTDAAGGPARLIFSGARLPLVYTAKGEIGFIPGDRQSIGYKRSDPHFEFTRHEILIEKGMNFYLSTDGYPDQLGGEKRISFGRKRFRELLLKHAALSFKRQHDLLLEAFQDYKGEEEQLDDISVLGFGFP